jgi:hypothetical protein
MLPLHHFPEALPCFRILDVRTLRFIREAEQLRLFLRSRKASPANSRSLRSSTEGWKSKSNWSSPLLYGKFAHWIFSRTLRLCLA